jgi:adenosylcobinamide-GDP ribazoletransferase
MSEYARILHAVRFLTVVPVSRAEPLEHEWLMRSAKYFPLVGILIGAFSATVLLAAAQAWSGLVPALLAVATGIAMTGALHEDGLADAADGLGGGRSRDARLAIMRDSRIGTYGALALGLCVAVRVAALATAPLHVAAAALIAAHAGGRMAAVCVMDRLPYGGDPVTAKIVYSTDRLRGYELVVALAFTGLGFTTLVVTAPWWTSLAALVGGAALAIAMAWLAARLIGGYTGDVLGSVEQLFQVGVFLAVATVWAR